MSGYWEAPNDGGWDAYTIMGFGSAHSVSSETQDDDKAEQVRQVADEITGETMPRPPLRRIGFV